MERLKSNPESYEETKRKQRERYHKNKRLVKDLTPKEKYNANLIWRLRKRELKKKKQMVERVIQNTPPSSPRTDSRLRGLNWDENLVSPRHSPAARLRSTRSRASRSSISGTPPPGTAPPAATSSASPLPNSLPPASPLPDIMPSITPPPATPPLATSPSIMSSLAFSTPLLPLDFSPLPETPPQAFSPTTTPASSSPLTIISSSDAPPASRLPRPTSSSAKARGRKKVKKDRSKVYRENEKLKEQNEKLKKKCDKYKKRSQRQSKTGKITKKTDDLRYEVLSKAIKKTFKETKSRRERQIIKNIFSTVEVNDSRIKKKLLKENLGIDKVVKNKYCLDRATLLKKKIKDFFLRDDITRASAGKKETVTKDKIKIQKRYLLDTLKNLHQTFKRENPDLHCSYFYFTQNKPFFVVSATVDARDMCMCKTHTNFAYKAIALRKRGITGTDDPNILIQSTVCNADLKDCMYGICDKCRNKKITYDIQKITGLIKWTEWTRKEEKYEKDGKMMKAIRNIREELNEDANVFMTKFEKDLAAFKKHVFNIKSQFRSFRHCLEQIQPNECIIIADFSENYNCKYHKEIQHHHFAGSRNQISLHTVVVYTFDNQTPEGHKVHSFCTVSASNIHQPAAVWCHLDPILKWLRAEFGSVDTVHFYSDGPSTQYRQKQNFYLMTTKFFDYGFRAMTWSFFEAGHGKGPADGVGGFLKRTADKIVANGEDIADVFQFYNKLNDVSKIKLFMIEEKDIHDLQKTLPTNIPRLIGTLKVHQVFSDCNELLKYRDLSCFCEEGVSGKRGFCLCLEPKMYDLRNGCNNTNNYKASSIQSDVDVENRDEAQESVETAKSSDDDEPLSVLKMIKELQDITNKRRKSIYEEVYGHSSDDEQPCSSYDKENSKIAVGEFLLVNVYADSAKKKTYTYVCKTLTDVEEDGEIKVMFLRVVDKNATRFRLDENDICYVDCEDVIQRLPNPEVVKRGHRVYYQFRNSVNIFEK